MKTLVHVLVLTSLLVLFSCNGGGSSSSATGTTSGNNTTSYNIGDSVGGGLYAGNTNGNDLIITPSGCTDSTTPTCNGGNDTVNKYWSTALNTIIGVLDTVNGYDNTDLIIQKAQTDGVQSPAASYCKDLVYGGYSDWYLPSQDEMKEIMDNNASNNNVLNFRDEQQNNGGVTNYHYYTSTESANDDTRVTAYAYDSSMPDGMGYLNHVSKRSIVKYSLSNILGGSNNQLVRCIRKQ